VKILVVGAGAVGGTVAARLARSGTGLRVFDTNAEHVALLRDPGLHVGGLDEGRTVRLDASTDVGDGPADIVLLAVRSQATAAAIDTIQAVLGPRTDVVSLQNGLNEDVIESRVGADRTIGCVVGFGATWVGPGHVTLDAAGDLTVGRIDGSIDDRLEAARHLLGLAFNTTITTNVLGALWAKVLVNSMTVMGALGGMLTGDLLATPRRRRIVAGVIGEGTRVARASGVALPKILGAVDADAVDTPRWESDLDRVLHRFGERFGAIKSVTWRDFEIGRPTEVDAVTGEIVRRGTALGVDVSRNAEVYRMLKEIERGDRAPGGSNIDALTD
jgi:2-dehydropantoate 2-reductase